MQALPLTPDVSHLTTEELKIIKSVLNRQELFENELEKSLNGLKQTLFQLETVSSAEVINCKFANSHFNRRRSSSLNDISRDVVPHRCKENLTNSLKNRTNQVVCYLCKKKLNNETSRFLSRLLVSKIFIKNELAKCSNCKNYTCAKCSTIADNSSKGSKTSRCQLCSIKIELACKSGKWVPQSEVQIIKFKSAIKEIKESFNKKRLLSELEIPPLTTSMSQGKLEPIPFSSTKIETKKKQIINFNIRKHSVPDLNILKKEKLIDISNSSSMKRMQRGFNSLCNLNETSQVNKDGQYTGLNKMIKLTRPTQVASSYGTLENHMTLKKQQGFLEILKQQKFDDELVLSKKLYHINTGIFSRKSPPKDLQLKIISKSSYTTTAKDRMQLPKSASKTSVDSLKPIVKRANSLCIENESIMSVKKVNFQTLVTNHHIDTIQRNYLPMFQYKKRRGVLRSLSTGSQSATVITTLNSSDLNKLMHKHDCANKSLINQNVDRDTMAKVILIEQTRSLNSTITEESNSVSNSGYSSRQSSTLSSETGIPRQITVGTYDFSESELGKTDMVQLTNQNQHGRRRELLMRQLSTDVTIDSVELGEEKACVIQRNKTKTTNHRKLPDTPNIGSQDLIHRKFIVEKFTLMEQGIKQAEKNLKSIKRKFYLNENSRNIHRRTTIDCNHSLETALKNISNLNNLETKSSNLHFSSFSKSIENICRLSVQIPKPTTEKGYRTSSRLRSIDYPCIVRKTPDLSDVVRKRLLFQKATRGINLLKEKAVDSNQSLEKEHIPKAVRRMIIRQDNSIEVSLSRSPKIRQQSLIENSYGFTPEKGFDSTSYLEGLIVSPQMGLSVPQGNERRKTIETCDNIFLQSEENTKLRVRTPPSNPHRILLYRDKLDKSVRTNGFGMRIMGGHECEDGSLGCFVTLVIPEGPADNNCIEVGDQIFEFNGNSIIDSTYEEVRILQNNCGDYVQLVVQHNNVRLNNLKTTHTSPLQVSRFYDTVPRLSQSCTRKRRNLPILPVPNSTNQNTFTDIQSIPTINNDYVCVETLQVPVVANILKPILVTRGRLLMQLWNDHKNLKLAVTINQASNLPPRCEDEHWYTFAIGRVIFYERPVKNFITVPLLGNNPTWNETYLFDYDHEKIEDVTIDIYLHDTQTPDDTRILKENFIGMIILPLTEANLDDEPRWYELCDKPIRKTSNTSVTFKSSSNDSISKIVTKKKKTSVKSRQGRLNKKGSNEIDETGVKGQVLNPVRKLSRAISRLFSKRRNSESSVHNHNIIQFYEVQDEVAQSDHTFLLSARNMVRRHTDVTCLRPDENENSLMIFKESNVAVNPSLEDIDSYFKNQNLMPGIGQEIPKTDQKTLLAIGDIKLGFLMSKGQLELLIYQISNLKISPNTIFTSDIGFVKAVLRDDIKELSSKKTQVIEECTEPVFNCTLKFTGSEVLGRNIQLFLVRIKREKGFQNFMKNIKYDIIGEAFIRLDNQYFDLSKQTIGWYKLYKI